MRWVRHTFRSQMVPLDTNLLKPLVTFSSFVFIVAELIIEGCSALQKIINIKGIANESRTYHPRGS